LPGRPRTETVSARISEETYLFLRFVGFNFSERIAEFLEGERLLLETGEHRTERMTRKREGD
jgi:hypothetical protein